MPVAVACSCGKSYRVKDDLVGKLVQCPSCGAKIRVEAPPPRPVDSNAIFELLEADAASAKTRKAQQEALAMSENPYQSPRAEAKVIGVRSGQRDDLRSVAKFQKGILVCILMYFIAVIFQFALPVEMRLLLGLGVLVLGLVGTVFVFLLAMKVYDTGLGIVLGILALIPCIGLIVLLIVNGKATAILKQNGIKVGLLGANLAEI